MNGIEIDLSKCIDNFKLDKDRVKQYGGYEKIATDLSKENMRLAFENHILQSKIDKAIEYYETHQQECVIGRNKDDKLIKEYYLPAQYSKKLYEFLKEDK